MVIYYAMTKFHLIFSITHKILKHANEAAVLFLYQDLQGVETNIARLEELGMFHKIYVVPEIDFRKTWNSLSDESTEAEIDENIRKMVLAVEDWLPMKISSKDTLYIANDHWAIGTYCIYKRIRYNYYEDGVGMLSKPDYSYELVRNLNVTHAIMARHMGAFGQNPCVITKLADLENQSEGFYDEKAIHFSLKEELKCLSKNDMKKLLYVFDAPNCGNVADATILLTEHFVNMKRLSIEGQRELYAMLVDLFTSGEKLFVKPHPNDFHISYPDIFEDVNMISRLFPSELLPYCFEEKFSLVLAACSTSVFGLQDKTDRILRFNIDIENYYQSLLKYYAVNSLMKLFKNVTVVAVNAHTDILDAYGITWQNEPGDGKNIFVVGYMDGELPAHAEDDIIVYLNEDGKYSVFAADIDYKDFTVIQIRKNCRRKNFVINSSDEYIYVISNDSDATVIRMVKEPKNMENTGMILDVDAITDDDKIKIKILEGNLKSALNRIEKYEQSEAGYKAEIADLKKQIENYDKDVIGKFKQMIMSKS